VSQQEVGGKQRFLLATCSAYSTSRMIAAVRSFETSVNFYQHTRRYIPEHSNIFKFKISQASACKLTFHSDKLRTKRSIQAALPDYYAIQCQYKSWDKTVKNKNMIPDFPREDAMETFRLITGHDCSAAHLQIADVSISSVCSGETP
jgi:hypothetical protein